jgi:Zn-dependent M28 family amino/carboxypeptidase
MKKITVLLLSLTIAVLSITPVKAQESNEAALKAHVYYLADDKLKGRLTGTKGAKLAANYIRKAYKDMGLTSLIGKKYIQEFEYTYTASKRGGHPVSKEQITGKNIVGFLDNGADKTILIGAHYDHLGGNEHHNSTDPNSKGEIHNGADDNASGVAMLIELARTLSTNDKKEQANYIFACFSAEEDGLMGSKALADYISKYVKLDLMINMDMLGRLNDERSIVVSGVGTSPRFPSIVESNLPADFKLTMDSSGVGPTDHTSFYLKDYPVLSFFTGSHSDYHKPTDDADKLNYSGMVDIYAYIYTILEDLEKEIETIQQTLSDPTNYQNLSAIQASPQPSDKQTMTQLSERLTLAEQALEIAFERWSELEP